MYKNVQSKHWLLFAKHRVYFCLLATVVNFRNKFDFETLDLTCLLFRKNKAGGFVV